jgi:hypothetical protein
MKRAIVASVEARIDEVLAAGAPFKKGELVAFHRRKGKEFIDAWMVATYGGKFGGKHQFELKTKDEDEEPFIRTLTDSQLTSDFVKTVKEGMLPGKSYKEAQLKQFITNSAKKAVQEKKEDKEEKVGMGMGSKDSEVTRVKNQKAALQNLKKDDTVVVNFAPQASGGEWIPGVVTGKEGDDALIRLNTGFEVSVENPTVVTKGLLGKKTYTSKELLSMGILTDADTKVTSWDDTYLIKLAKTNEEALGSLKKLVEKDPVVVNFIPESPTKPCWYAGYIRDITKSESPSGKKVISKITFEWNDGSRTHATGKVLTEWKDKGLIYVTPKLLKIRSGITYAAMTKKLPQLDGDSLLKDAQAQSQTTVKPVLKPADVLPTEVPKTAEKQGAKTASATKKAAEPKVKPQRPARVKEEPVEEPVVEEVKEERPTRKPREAAPTPEARPTRPARVRGPIADDLDMTDTGDESEDDEPAVQTRTPNRPARQAETSPTKPARGQDKRPARAARATEDAVTF